MDPQQRLLALKRDFLVPCVYHFYRRPPVLVRGEGAYLFDADGQAYLDCYSGVTVVNAGHPTPLVIRRSTGKHEEATPKDAIGLPLGVIHDFVYDQFQVQLEPVRRCGGA